MRRGFHENRKKGLFCGGNIIFGYRVENKKILIHEDEAKIVRYIFDQYIRGRQAKDIGSKSNIGVKVKKEKNL